MLDVAARKGEPHQGSAWSSGLSKESLLAAAELFSAKLLHSRLDYLKYCGARAGNIR
jgi:hypothetical protein